MHTIQIRRTFLTKHFILLTDKSKMIFPSLAQRIQVLLFTAPAPEVNFPICLHLGDKFKLNENFSTLARVPDFST